MKIFKKIKRNLVLCKPRHEFKCATNNLPRILFHQIHGQNVRLSPDGSYATRVESFCKGIVFSNRNIKVNETVLIKLSEISTNWSGSLRFGFTCVNPSSFNSCANLPKYVCPDLTNMDGNWAKAMSEKFVKLDNVIGFKIDSDGAVHYSVNGADKGIFFTGVNVNSPLWAVIDIYGNTTGIEFMDPRSTASANIENEKQINEIEQRQVIYHRPKPPTYEAVLRQQQQRPIPPPRRRMTSTENIYYPDHRCSTQDENSGYSTIYVPLNIKVQTQPLYSSTRRPEPIYDVPFKQAEYAVIPARQVGASPNYGTYSKLSSAYSACTSLPHSLNSLSNECTVCYEHPINSVLYTCGHMCMCFGCATKQFSRGTGHCPICRAPIRDVIKTYWS